MENTYFNLIVIRLAQRLRVSIATARVVAELAGLAQGCADGDPDATP